MKNLFFASIFMLATTIVFSQITDENGVQATGALNQTLTGKIGIGTSSPSEQLEVNGTSKAIKGVFTNGNGGATLSMGGEWAPNKRNVEYHIVETATGDNEIQVEEIIYGNNGNLRKYHNIKGNRSYFSYRDENGSDFFKLDEGGLGNNKVFLHMPKLDSRIVIGSHGAYLPEHKFVVKEGSAMIEGNILTNNNLGIGTSSFTDGSDTYRLSVDGKIRAEGVKVYTDWADFVFEEGYKLPTLQEVEAHIAKHGHLKDIPSAKEVEEKGIELGEMNKLLLQKIEELTLYTIQLKKELDQLKVRTNDK